MRLFRFSLVLACLLSPATSRAELASLFGLGPKSAALGGTSLNSGRYTPFQVYAAPAALGYLRKVEVDFGAQYLDPRVRPFGTVVLNSGGTMGEYKDSGVLPGGGNLLAFGLPIGGARPLTLGGAVYLPFTTLIRVSGSPVNYPFYPLYTDLSRNFFFVVGAGYEFVDGWAFGVNVRSTTKSTVNYVLRSDSSVSYSASAVEAKSESRLSYSLVYDHGRRHPAKPWTVGAMYRSHAAMETKLVAGGTAFIPIQGELTSLPSYTPAEWVVMGSYPLPAHLTLALDVARVLWSKYSSPYGTGNINTYVIDNRHAAANFHDITVIRAGLERRTDLGGATFRQLAYRLGYQYHPSPVPDQNGDTNFVDTDRHLISAGLGAGIQDPWRAENLIDVDIFFQANLLKRRAITKNSMTNVGAPGYLAGGEIYVYGIGASLRF